MFDEEYIVLKPNQRMLLKNGFVMKILLMKRAIILRAFTYHACTFKPK